PRELRKQMAERVNELADKLSLDNVEIVSDASKLDGKKRKAKGFYTKSTGKITIIIGNHTSIADVEKTLLHEAVAHYGLRKMFGAHFETFLDNVFNNADESVRRKIVELSIKNGWDFRKATEEYLAGLAESTNFEEAKKSGWWNKVKSLFCELLQELGFADYNDVITDNELRYVLWRSYENMKENKYSGLLSEATDVAKQYELSVGEFADFYSNRKALVRERENTQLSAHRLDTDALTDANIVNDSEIQATDDENLLYRSSSPRSEAQDIYEKATTRSFLHNLSEGWYDHLRSVQALQESLEKELGRKVEDFENVYLNAMFKSSVDMKEIEAMQKLVESLMDTVVSITSEKGISQKDVERYMNCKHGEERNEKFAKRDTERAKKARISELDKLLSNGDIDQAKYDERVKEADKKSKKDYAYNRERDYSGLTAIFDPERTGMSNSELESEAKYYVKDFEESVPTYKIDALWKSVKELTHFTLTKAYKSGNISKEQYAETSNQFEYYVPLRGFSEDTADDVYDYVTREVNPTQKTLKEAKGRSSEAGNILATMMNMGHSSIVQGNKNKVKQKLLNLALNATNPLLSVTRTWYDKSTDEMLKPNITTNMTADEQRAEVERFDEEMLHREKCGDVERHRGSFDIGKRAEKWQADEHCVRVMRNGEEYQIWINGNPKAAQAINGILNPDAGNISLIERTGNTINRFVARNVTSLSINFIVSNFQRDVISSNLVGFAKYGFKYQTQFNRNVKNNLSFLNVKGDKAFRSDSIYSLYHRYNKGTLDMSNERDNYFSEFLKNGGETGYSQMRTIDDYEKVIAKSLRKGTARGKAEKAWAAIGTTIEFANKGIENSCRFAAYMTGRQNGMSVLQSIDDAKECSVNFNRKGSGAMGNQFAKAMYMFLNPAIQGVMQYIMLTKKYPKRMLPLMGGWAALGFVMPMIAQAIIGAMMGGEDGDDDDDYYNLSAWTRRNNLIIPIGKNNYAKIALPPEIRAMYGLGEIAYGMYAGGDKYENKFAATTSQLSQLLPLDVVDANGIVRYDESIWKGVVRGITPSWASPGIDAYLWNEDFIGRPITGHTKYDTGVEPEYTKVSKGTLQFLIDASHWINNHTGGTDYTKGKVDGVLGSMFNPSAIEYQFNAYLGGLSQIAGQMWKTTGALFGNEEYQEVRNYPIVNKLVANTDNDYAMYMQSNEGWQYYKTEKEVTDAIMKGLQSDTKKGIFEKAKDIAEYAKTPESKRSETIKAYQKYINKCYDKAKYEKEDSEKKRLIKEAQELKKKCVEKLEE
ncbi:MAG: LPD38 domain-containing protein, partial [Muribaculaceae bacterium]